VPDTIEVHNVLTDQNLGQLDIRKTDAESSSSGNISGETLEGAVFELINRSDRELLINSVSYSRGSTVATLTANENGFATTGRILPFGTYGVREKTAPEGYIKDSSEKTVTVNDYRQTLSLDYPNEVIRSSLSLKKTDAYGKELENIVFRISLIDENGNKTESHIAVTDSHGLFDSAALFVLGQKQDQ